MKETIYGDTKTAADRLGRGKYLKVARFALFAAVLLWISVLIWTAYINHAIAAKQYSNILKYNDVNGFKPVHRN